MVVLNRKTRFLYPRTDIRGNNFKSLYIVMLDRFDREVPLPGMVELVMRNLARNEGNIFHEFFGEI